MDFVDITLDKLYRITIILFAMSRVELVNPIGQYLGYISEIWHI